mmetsp:Transcript_6230/g.20465  ORF Transcript_6230/g.20465 Transcript_6230/m.20465 type:complete len:298 (-) Transcript_6230:115-1008(-)|eukprot:scaffold3542_cov113-Isochrysis_galbana.AAC.15
MASRVCTVVARLGREPPGWLAHGHRVRLTGVVVHPGLARALERAGVVRQQTQALPQVAVHLLPVARLPHVDVANDVLDLVPVMRRLVGQPSAKGVEVPVGRVERRVGGDLGRRSKQRRPAQLPLQVAAQPAGHRPPVGLAGYKLIGRVSQVLRVLVGRAARGDAFPLLAVVTERLIAAHVQVPRAEQRGVPVREVGVVWLRVIWVILGARHPHAVEAAPQRRAVAVLAPDRAERLREERCLFVDLGRRRQARVAPVREGVGRNLCGVPDALLQYISKVDVWVGAHPNARKGRADQPA